MSKGQIHKEKGNDAFKAGKFVESIGFYTDAILADRTEPTYPLNRAAAYLKLGKHQDAERDCSTIIDMKPQPGKPILAKAFFRRGQAKMEMHRYTDASMDFFEALRLRPDDAAVKAAYDDCDIKVIAATERAKASTRAKALPQDPKSPPPRRRVPIEIVYPSGSSSSVADTPKAQPAKAVGGAGLTAVSSRSLDSSSPSKPSQRPSSPSTNLSSTKEDVPPVAESSRPKPVARAEINPLPNPAEKPSSFKEAKQNRETARPSRVGGGIFSNSAPAKVFPTRDVTSPETKPATPKETQPIEPQVSVQAKKLPQMKAPETFTDLLKSWRTLRSPEERWALLATIPPPQFPSLAKTSMETDFLSSIFQTLHDLLPGADLDTQNAVKAFLEYLPLVSRFNTIFLFLSNSEKGIVREVWKKLGVDFKDAETSLAKWSMLLR